MPLTKTGKKVLRQMKKEYGKKKGKSVFYASINKKKKGSHKWHKTKERDLSSHTDPVAKKAIDSIKNQKVVRP